MYPVLMNWPISIHSYGFCLAIGFLGGILLFAKNLKDNGGEEDLAYEVSFWILLLSIIGARAMFVFVEFERFQKAPWTEITLGSWSLPFPAILAVWKGGLVYYGGLLGGIVAVMGCSWYYRFSIPDFGDFISPGLAWGQLTGRLGCFLNGCCYGAPTDLFCGVVFPHATLVGGELVSRHPTQLYSVLFFSIAVPTLMFLMPKKPFKGSLMFGYLTFYSLFRFLMEMLRDDPRGGFYLAQKFPVPFENGFSVSQVISLGMFLLSLLFFLFCWLKKERPREYEN